MTIAEVISERERLETQLYKALGTLEKKDTVRQIYEQLKLIQNNCPHYDESGMYNYAVVDDTHCPYCGKIMSKEDWGN